MAIAVQCHQCGGEFAAPDAMAGRVARCPRCGAAIEVPHAVAALPAAALSPLPDPFAAAARPVQASFAYPQQPAAGGGVPWAWIVGAGFALLLIAGCVG